jgi:hypothetical protein
VEEAGRAVTNIPPSEEVAAEGVRQNLPGAIEYVRKLCRREDLDWIEVALAHTNDGTPVSIRASKDGSGFVRLGEEEIPFDDAAPTG